MKTQLTPTTKELIFGRIIELERDIRTKNEMIMKINSMPPDDKGTQDFIEFWELEIELMDNQIEQLKFLLFNR